MVWYERSLMNDMLKLKTGTCEAKLPSVGVMENHDGHGGSFYEDDVAIVTNLWSTCPPGLIPLTILNSVKPRDFAQCRLWLSLRALHINPTRWKLATFKLALMYDRRLMSCRRADFRKSRILLKINVYIE